MFGLFNIGALVGLVASPITTVAIVATAVVATKMIKK